MKPLLALLALAAIAHAAPAPLVLISLDGFRWDYCELYQKETPNLRRLARTGVSAKALVPVYPSNTFPNHYSIVTGLYPSHHGIINNLMFDPGRGEFFRYNRAASATDGRWWQGEPIWVTAIRQGRKSACNFWPGSEAEIGGVRPTFFKPFDPATSSRFLPRVEEVIGWLKQPPEQQPAIVTLYLDAPNGIAHKQGPDSPEVIAVLRLVDDAIGTMLARFASEGLAANFIIVSDHGMAPCSVEKVVVLDDYLDLATVQIDFDETSAGLRPLPGNTVGAMMRALAALPPQAKAYQAENLPPHFHVDPKNPRVPPVWIVPAEGWQVARRSVYNAAKEKFLKGQHGYDPALPSMRGIFIAHGPAFKTGVQVDAVENIHIYNLLCAALGLKPAPNDGDDRLVTAALR